MFAWRSIVHPLKPLLYIEWLLLLLAAVYPWLSPQDTLSIIFDREGMNRSISVGVGTSNPIGWLIPIGWLVACILCWRVPKSNKLFITFILVAPIVFLTPIYLVIPPLILNWIAFGSFLAAFAWLGTQISQQQTVINQWLFTAVEFILIWWIFAVIAALPPQHSANLESLLLLHLIGLIRAFLMFGGRSRWVAVVAFFGSYHMVSIVIGMVWSQFMGTIDRAVTLYPDDIRQIARGFIFNVTVVFTLVTILLVWLVLTLVSERRNREKLAEAHYQLRQYASQIQDQTMLAERNRIAREIHDSLGHTLTAQSIQLENALVYLPTQSDQAQKFLTQAHQLSQTALQEVRRSVSQMRNNLLMGQSFEQAIGELIGQFQMVMVCAVEYDYAVGAVRIPIEVQTALYRIVQEALTNITRHSNADRVRVVVDLSSALEIGTVDGLLRLRIEDNGDGFQFDQNTSGFGLQGMRERAAAIGGQWQIQSMTGQGCVVQVEVPTGSWLIPSAFLSSMIKP